VTLKLLLDTSNVGHDPSICMCTRPRPPAPNRLPYIIIPPYVSGLAFRRLTSDADRTVSYGLFYAMMNIAAFICGRDSTVLPATSSTCMDVTAYYDKVPKAVNFRAPAPKNQLRILELKDAISRRQIDVASFKSRILS